MCQVSFAQTCNFTFTDESVRLISKAVASTSFVVVRYLNFTQNNLPVGEFYFLKDSSLFVIKPESNFYSLGLVSRQFQFINLQGSGNFCSVTNGIPTPTPESRANLMMIMIYNITQTLQLCSADYRTLEQNTTVPDGIGLGMATLLAFRRNSYYCCSASQCSLQEEPSVFVATQFVLHFFRLVLTALFIYVFNEKIKNFDKKDTYSDYLTDNYESPIKVISAFFPRFRKVSEYTGFILSVLVYLVLFCILAFLTTLAPTDWPYQQQSNIFISEDYFRLGFASFQGVMIIVLTILLVTVSTLRILFKKDTRRDHPHIFIIGKVVLSVVGTTIVTVILCLLILPSLLDFGSIFYIFSILFGALYSLDVFSVTSEEYTIFKSMKLQRSPVNLYLSNLLNLFFFLCAFYIFYYTSTFITSVVWFNMVAVLLYPSNLTVYSAFLAVIYIFFDFITKSTQPYVVVKSKLIKKACKTLEEIRDDSTLIPITWDIFFQICDDINFFSTFYDSLRLTIIQISVVTIFFLAVVMFVKDTFDDMLKIGLTSLLPILPKISSMLFDKIDSLDGTIFDQRFEMSYTIISKSTVQSKELLGDGVTKYNLVVVHEEM